MTDIKKLALNSHPDHFKYILNNILVPRSVGTENHENVKKFIMR